MYRICKVLDLQTILHLWYFFFYILGIGLMMATNSGRNM